jgi:hypothetical protein
VIGQVLDIVKDERRARTTFRFSEQARIEQAQRDTLFELQGAVERWMAEADKGAKAVLELFAVCARDGKPVPDFGECMSASSRVMDSRAQYETDKLKARVTDGRVQMLLLHLYWSVASIDHVEAKEWDGALKEHVDGSSVRRSTHRDLNEPIGEILAS